MSILDYPPTSRFEAWRSFRKTLHGDLTDLDHLRMTAEYWAKCPTVGYYIDWDDPPKWPAPWELIYEGQLCPSGIALCIFHTLLYSEDRRWNDRLKLHLIKDASRGIFLVVGVDDEYFLSYTGYIGNEIKSECVIQNYIFIAGKYQVVT